MGNALLAAAAICTVILILVIATAWAIWHHKDDLALGSGGLTILAASTALNLLGEAGRNTCWESQGIDPSLRPTPEASVWGLEPGPLFDTMNVAGLFFFTLALVAFLVRTARERRAQ